MEEKLISTLIYGIFMHRSIHLDDVRAVYDELKSIDSTVDCINYAEANALDVLDCARTKIFIA